MPWLWSIVAGLGVLAIAEGLILIGLITRIVPVLAGAEAILAQHAAPSPEPGTALPPVSLRALDGGIVEPRDWLGQPHILLFLSAFCPSCDDLVADLARAADFALPVTIVAGAESAPLLERRRRPGGIRIVADEDGGFAGDFGADATPLAVLVDRYGRVRRSIVPRRADDLIRLATEVASPDPVG